MLQCQAALALCSPCSTLLHRRSGCPWPRLCRLAGGCQARRPFAADMWQVACVVLICSMSPRVCAMTAGLPLAGCAAGNAFSL